jgi:hypothetical protein
MATHGMEAHGGGAQLQLPLRASPSSSAFLRSVLSQERRRAAPLHATDFSLVGSSLAWDVQAAAMRAADAAGVWAAQVALCVSSPVLALVAMLRAVLVAALEPHTAAGAVLEPHAAAGAAVGTAAVDTAEYAGASAAAELHTSTAAPAPVAEAATAPDASAATAAAAASPWWAQARSRASVVSVSAVPQGAIPAAALAGYSSSGSLVRIALPVVALAAVAAAAVAFARRVAADRAREKRLHAVLEMNGMSLGRQKQRFLNAINSDETTSDEEDRAYDAEEEQELPPLPMPGRSERAMAASWESFVHGSKTDSVNDVWNKAKTLDMEAPRVSKKKLEEMSARVRSAQPAPSSREFVSFDAMCQEEDFDAGMEARVAQRKARYQGQFLSNEDVGLTTPKGSTAGSARAGSGKGLAGKGTGAPPRQPAPHPPMRPAPPPPLRLNASTEDIADSEFQQSLRMRSQLEYIHPAALGPLAKSELKRAGIAANKAVAAAAAQAGQQQRAPSPPPQQQPATPYTDDEYDDEALLLRGASRARTANAQRRAGAAGGRGGGGGGGGGYDDDDDDEALLPPPLSSVSIGLLRGAARAPTANEHSRAARAGAGGGVRGSAVQQPGSGGGGVTTAAPDAQQQQQA